MNIPKNLLNLIGIALVAGILIAGITLIALPAYLRSNEIHSERDQAAAANNAQQAQVEALRQQAKELAQMEAEVTQLRGQIPASPVLDSALEVAVKAARTADVSLVSMTSEDAADFVEADGTDPDDAAAPAADATPTEGATTSPTRQIRLVFTVEASKTSDIPEFLDGLRVGPRLIRIVKVETTTASNKVSATVTTDVFVYNTGQQK